MNKLRLLTLVLGVAGLGFTISRCTKAPAASYESWDTDPQYAHPLDPLDSIEVKLVKSFLIEKKLYTKDHYFSFIKLEEPSKAEVLAYKPGQPFRREALTSVYNPINNVLIEYKIDLKGKQILSVDTMKGMIPVGLLSIKTDSTILAQVMPTSKEWVEAVKKRGIPLDSITYSANTAADMGMAPKGNREEIVSARYKNKRFGSLGIPGLSAMVDLTARKVLKVVDTGKGYSQPYDVNYFKEDSAIATIEPTKPLKIEQPDGVTFSVKGHEVTWNNWKFRYGISSREGLIIYQAAFNDNGNWRSVMYRGSMPEMVVNYGSPDLKNASNNFFDVGVYRLGMSRSKSMTPGADAPENAYYLPSVMHNDTGKVISVERAVAIYEEFDGPLWRHNKKGVPATNLAIKYFTTIGNYDYAFRWVFRQDGQIDIVTELNGIAQIRAVNRTSDMPGAPDETYQGSYYGTLVDQHVEAVNHQHFFMFRLDMDVDGANNMAAEMNTMAVPDGPQNPYKNTMITQMVHFKKEQEAQRSINAGSNRHWKIMNEGTSDKWGHHSAYMLMPSSGVKPLVNEGSSLLNRAGFLRNHVWVTPLADKEIYPAGDYPGSNMVKPGLPSWTAKNRDIANKDLVLWYLAGVTHIVRPEEWPIMTPHTVKFSLMPAGFFSQNPVVKMPNKPVTKSPLAMFIQASGVSAPLCDTPADQANLAKVTKTGAGDKSWKN